MKKITTLLLILFTIQMGFSQKTITVQGQAEIEIKPDTWQHELAIYADDCINERELLQLLKFSGCKDMERRTEEFYGSEIPVFTFFTTSEATIVDELGEYSSCVVHDKTPMYLTDEEEYYSMAMAVATKSGLSLAQDLAIQSGLKLKGVQCIKEVSRTLSGEDDYWLPASLSNVKKVLVTVEISVRIK